MILACSFLKGNLMKKIILLLALTALTCSASDSLLKPVNDIGYGTISGRIQTLSMYRDFDGNDGANTTLGFVLSYLSPEFAGFDFGLTYNVAGEYLKSNNSGLMANDDINVLNEAWVRYRITTNTALTVGRKVNNGEVFRGDDFRQKARAIEAVQLEINEVENLKLTLGHAFRMSNWIDAGDRWDFNDFGDVPGFGSGDDTDGITWVEAVYTGITNLELAVYDAYAHDIANIAGLRAKYKLTDDTTLNGYYRHEGDVGRGAEHNSDMFGASVQQKIGSVTLEPGYFGIYGDGLLFQETTTGINHPLGSLMLIYTGQFAGDSDTFYLKATTKVGKTALYALYSYTWNNSLSYDGQELNVVVKQPIGDRLSVALKVGAGYRDDRNGGADTVATDTRLFVTYNF